METGKVSGNTIGQNNKKQQKQSKETEKQISLLTYHFILFYTINEERMIAALSEFHLNIH